MGIWKERQALIIAAAPETEYGYLRAFLQRVPDAVVICADGGLRHARALGRFPDLMISDCDSCAETEGQEVIRLRPEKDDTDTQACLRQAIARGCREITLACATGGRLDHTLANLSLLEEAAAAGVQCTLLDRQNKVLLHQGGTVQFKNDPAYPYFSLVPLDAQLEDVTITGAKYPLTHAAVPRAGMVTISNEPTAPEVCVTVGTGKSLLVFSTDRPL